jgi:hypothetical protein
MRDPITGRPTPGDLPPGATIAPELIASVFRGAREWRNARAADLQAVIADAENPGPDTDPCATPDPFMLAALWCDIAFKAERDFQEALRTHGDALNEVERRLGRSRQTSN